MSSLSRFRNSISNPYHKMNKSTPRNIFDQPDGAAGAAVLGAAGAAGAAGARGAIVTPFDDGGKMVGAALFAKLRLLTCALQGVETIN